jgi:hypothetical protein
MRKFITFFLILLAFGLFSGPLAQIQWDTIRVLDTMMYGPYFMPVVADPNGNLWMGTSTAGLIRYNLAADSVTVFNVDNSSLWSNWVGGIIPDKNGDIWVHTYGGGGLVRLSRQGTWSVWDTSNSPMPTNRVRKIALDSSGKIWAGTIKGLAGFNGHNTWEIYDTSNSLLPADQINALAVDHDNNLWVGTDYGLARFNGRRFDIFRRSNSGLVYNVVSSLAVDSLNRIWIGTWSGMNIFDGADGWETYYMNGTPFPIWPTRSLYPYGPSAVTPTGEIYAVAFGGAILIGRDDGTASENLPPANKSFELAGTPNPFAGAATILFRLPQSSKVSLNVYDVRGHKVSGLVHKRLAAGAHRAVFNADGLPAGVYFVRLTAGGRTLTRKLFLSQ